MRLLLTRALAAAALMAALCLGQAHAGFSGVVLHDENGAAIDFSTLAAQTTLAAVLAKLTSDPATQTTLAAVLAKLTSDPSTATGQSTTNTDLGPPGATACATDTGSCSLNALLQRALQRLTTVNTTLGTPLQAGGAVTTTIANPTSTLTRPADTTAYAQNDLIASSATAGSVVVPSFAITGGSAIIPRLRLFTNVTTGWDAAVIRVRLFTAAPTYTNGDNGAYARATGSDGLIARYDVTLTQQGDGAAGQAPPLDGGAAFVKLASGTAVYWDLQLVSAAGVTPISGQTFTVTAENVN
jgi:hypothetical protein